MVVKILELASGNRWVENPFEFNCEIHSTLFDYGNCTIANTPLVNMQIEIPNISVSSMTSTSDPLHNDYAVIRVVQEFTQSTSDES